VLTISDGPIFDFGAVAVGGAADHTFTIMNTGGAAATALAAAGTAGGPFAPKGGAFPGTNGTCGTTLAAGASCTIVVTFAPTAAGAAQAMVGVAYDDGAGARMATLGVKGSGGSPALLVLSDDPTYAFGAHVLTTSTDHGFTLTNTGGVDATNVAPAALAAPYAYKGGTAPGMGGTCGATLAAGKTCTLVVTFAPTVSGEADATLKVAYSDGVTGQTAQRPMAAFGVAPALLAISDGPAFDFGVEGLGVGATHVFTISNTGGAAAQGLALGAALAAPFALQGAGLAASGTCGATLAAFTSCTVAVVFTPSAAGAASATFSIAYNDGLAAQSATRALAGTGTTHAFLAISDGPTYDFGTRALGASASHVFTVSNTGAVTAASMAATALAAPFSFTGGTYPGTAGTCMTSLAAGAACKLDVTFSATAATVAAGTLQLGYDDGFGAASPATRALKGAGTNLAFLAISDGPQFTFATTADGGQDVHTFTVTNTGLADASALAGGALAAPFTYKGGTYPGGGTCMATLAAGASCTVVVAFRPTTPGLATATLSIAYNDSLAAATASVALQGSGALPALLAISDGPTYDFGTFATGFSAAHTFTVINVGGLAAGKIVPAALTAPFAFAGTSFPGGGTCGTTLAPGTSCTFAVAFAPTANGAASGKAQLGYDDGAMSTTSSVGLAGAGAAPAQLSISDGPTYDFGTRAVGVATGHTFTVMNGGGVDATALTPAALAPGFSFAGTGYPGTGGTCAATLAAGASCTLTVAFTPPSAGPFAGTLGLGYGNGVTSDAATRPLKGAGAAPALLAISDGPTYDFQTRATGSTTTHAFTVSNTGGVDATAIVAGALLAPFGYAGGAYPGALGTCGTTLAAGASCAIVVAFTPASAGGASGSLGLSYNDGVSGVAASVGLAGAAAAPALLAISDGPTFDFQTHAVGSSTDHTFVVTNGGGVAATMIVPTTLASPFVYQGGGAFPGATGTCGTSLAAGTSCKFVVTFAPSGAGMASSSVQLGYDDGAMGKNVSVGLAGAGAGPAVLAISDGATYDYQTHATGSTTSHTFMVTNSGGVDATALSPSALGAPYAFPGGYPGATGNCGATLAAGASCSIVVTFSPSSATTSPATLTLGYNDGVTTQSATRPLTGTGAAAAALSISDGPTYDFGLRANGASVTHTFTVTNNGGVAATSVAGNLPGAPFSYPGVSFPGGGNCGTTLAAGTSCTVVVAFSPTVSGPASAALTVMYNDGAVAGRSASVSLSGTSTPPALLFISDPATYDFGALSTTGKATHVFHVENDGGFAAKSIAPAALGAPYSYAGSGYPGLGGTCGATLAAGATCTIVVGFAPTMAGTFPAMLSLGYDDGATAQSATRPLTGKGTTAAYLSITDFPPLYYAAYGLQSDPPSYDFGGEGLNTTTPHQFFVTNTGAASATTISGGALAAPFAWAGGTFPGSGGSCSATLAAGSTCTVVVTFHPTSAASSSTTFAIGYDDGTGPQSATRGIKGTGTNGPVLTIWDFQTGSTQGVDVGPEWNYGVRGIGVTDDHQFYVTNSGGGVAINITAPSLGPGFLYKGNAYPGTNGSCGTTLAPGASCFLDVAFSPVTTGAASSKILLNYTDTPVTGSFQASRGIAGVGTNLASLEIWANGQNFDTLVYDYGFHATGSTTPHTFTVVNAGAATATALAALALPAPFVYAGSGGNYPGSGGTCMTSLAAQSSCTIVVNYAPTVGGNATGTITLGYNDGQAAQSARRDVSGTATAYAFLTINNWPSGGGGGQVDDPFDFGTSGVPIDHTFALQNIGAQTATSLAGIDPAAPFSFKGGMFPGQGGSCMSTLAVGASCTVVVTYSGASTGASTWSASYADGSGGTVQVGRNVTGTTVTTAVLEILDCPDCGPSSQPADFGMTGTISGRTFTVKNVGSQPATAMADAGALGDGFSYGSGATYPGSQGNCGSSLAPGATCLVSVVFQPPSPGPHASALKLAYNDSTGLVSASRTLTGTGISTALLDISDWQGGGGGGGNNPPPYDYGKAGVPIDHTFSVSNQGAQIATSIGATVGLGNGFAYKGTNFPGTGGSCTSSLAVGTSCTIVVTFTPPGTGSYSAKIAIAYGSNGAPPSSTATRDVTGTGISTALLTINPWGPGGSNSPYDYGTFGTPTDHTFTVVNTGAQAATSITDGATLGANFAFKDGMYPGTGGNCDVSLNAGAQCSIVVTFKPSGSGAKAGTITLDYNDGTNPSAQATQVVTGTALSGPFVRIYDWQGQTFNNGQQGSQPPFDYGTWGVHVYHTFTVSNDGSSAALNLADGGTLGGYFSYEGGNYPGAFGGSCGSSLAAGAQCYLTVRFDPMGSSGLHSSKITLNYTDGASVAQPPVVRDLVGTATLAALLQIGDSLGGCGEGCGPAVFPTVAVGGTSEVVFNINNNGGGTATLMSDTGTLALPFKYKGLNGFPGQGGNCGPSLASGASCLVVVDFVPSTPGGANSVWGVNYHDGQGGTPTVSRSVSGTATP
jgi:hypothetical protein